MPKLVDIKTLSAESGLPVRTIRELMRQRKISFRKLSYKLLRFDPEQVERELKKYEVAAVA